MKPIINCLDEILKELKKSYENELRPPLPLNKLQNYFEDKLNRHETFIGLIDILIKEGNAELLTEKIHDRNSSKIDQYQRLTIITVNGLYFIESGGYRKKTKADKIKNRIQRWVNISFISGGLAAAIYYIVQLIVHRSDIYCIFTNCV